MDRTVRQRARRNDLRSVLHGIYGAIRCDDQKTSRTLAVTERAHAALNTKAQMRRPITVEDHQNSPWIVYPFRLARLLFAIRRCDGRHRYIWPNARVRCVQAPVLISGFMGGIYPPQPDPTWQIEGVRTAPILYER